MRNKKPPFEITNQMIDYVAKLLNWSETLM